MSAPTEPRLRPVSIVGTGSFLPKRVLTNADLERMVDTSDDWIVSRTGVRERRIAGENEHTSDLALGASRRALEMAGVTPEQIDMILVATITADMVFPATACWLQRKLGATRAGAFDLGAACSGFLYALEIARQFVGSGVSEHVLIVGAEKLSTIVDWKDRNTCVLFGDGAGAAVVAHRPDRPGTILSHLGADGRLSDILHLPGSGCVPAPSAEVLGQQPNTIRMQGREVFKQAVTAMDEAARKVLEKAGVGIDQVACVIPHQANMRIIDAIASRLKIPRERFFINLERYGNTSAAAVAIALDEANRQGRLRPGDYVLLIAFGGGLTWASTLIRW